jgi:hypothetical protein
MSAPKCKACGSTDSRPYGHGNGKKPNPRRKCKACGSVFVVAVRTATPKIGECRECGGTAHLLGRGMQRCQVEGCEFHGRRVTHKLKQPGGKCRTCDGPAQIRTGGGQNIQVCKSPECPDFNRRVTHRPKFPKPKQGKS